MIVRSVIQTDVSVMTINKNLEVFVSVKMDVLVIAIVVMIVVMVVFSFVVIGLNGRIGLQNLS